MLRRWAQAMASIALAIAVVGTPCRNCQPAPDERSSSGRDCCSKSKPAQKSCSWQPAGFDAVEKAQQVIEPAPAAVVPAAWMEAPVAEAQGTEGPAPAPDSSPPPLFLSQRNLRI